jgi:[NiFe] hydrogenase assembly HybE family chaperone
MNAVALARVAQLEQVFAQIGATRMQGVPVLHAALRVQAVDFEVLAGEEPPVLLGILITPWFMNLLRLPLLPSAAAASPTPGSKRRHVCGAQVFEFIAAQEDALGAFEACSLFSPMFEFADQAGAVATASEVLKLLRTPPAEVTMAKPAASSPTGAPAVPSRRGFLFGRSRPGATP